MLKDDELKPEATFMGLRTDRKTPIYLQELQLQFHGSPMARVIISG